MTEPWKRGEWKDIVLRSAKATAKTEASVLGQNDKVLEYQRVVPKTTWKQEADGLHIHAMFAQRIQDKGNWPNPLVVKIANVEPALIPPRIETGQAVREGTGVTLHGTLRTLGDTKSLEVCFEYRSITGLDTNERSGEWTATPYQRMDAPGAFSATAPAWAAGEPYEFRAAVKHPALTMYGEAKTVRLP